MLLSARPSPASLSHRLSALQLLHRSLTLPSNKMSNRAPTTIADLPRITREDLRARLASTSQSQEKAPAVIDVRGDDHIGGHIRGSTNVPAATLDDRLPELVRELRDKDTVVFHCALSQQRGPSAALRYLRERERVLGEGEGAGVGEGGEGKEEKEEGKEEHAEGEGQKERNRGQKVYVLDGGFVKWQEK